MPYAVVYHQLVVNDDIPALSAVWQTKIRAAIENRLQTRPDFYGKPLRRSLKNYRKLRVEDYRVIFKLDGQTVKVLMIAHRSVVYKKISQRV